MEDFVAGWRKMQAALRQAGYRPSDLRRSQTRGTAPPSYKQGFNRLYRWSEVKAWAEAKKRAHKIDPGETTLGRWLKPRETAWRFANRTGIPLRHVYRLLGHKTSLWREKLPPHKAIEEISAATGIPIRQLIADAPEEPF